MLLTTYDPESLAGEKSIADTVATLRARAKSLRINAEAARARGQATKVAIARQSVRLVGFKKRSQQGIQGLGEESSWLSYLNPLNTISAIADKATELVTGISPEQVAATEKQAAWAAQAIAERQQAGTITSQEANTLRAQTAEAVQDARAASSVANVLADTAIEAARTANSALGDPVGLVTKYAKYAAVAAGGVAALMILRAV